MLYFSLSFFFSLPPPRDTGARSVGLCVVWGFFFFSRHDTTRTRHDTNTTRHDTIFVVVVVGITRGLVLLDFVFLRVSQLNTKSTVHGGSF